MSESLLLRMHQSDRLGYGVPKRKIARECLNFSVVSAWTMLDGSEFHSGTVLGAKAYLSMLHLGWYRQRFLV